jgi:hypothetical protein
LRQSSSGGETDVISSQFDMTMRRSCLLE